MSNGRSRIMVVTWADVMLTGILLCLVAALIWGWDAV